MDLAVGVVLRAKVGDRVEAGGPLAEMHAASREAAAAAEARLAEAFVLSPEPVPAPTGETEVVAPE